MLYAGGRGYGPGKVMSSKAHLTVAGLILTALLFFMGVQAVMAQSRPLLDSAPVVANWRGDFDGMLQRRVVRLIVPYSRTLFTASRSPCPGALIDRSTTRTATRRSAFARTIPNCPTP